MTRACRQPKKPSKRHLQSDHATSWHAAYTLTSQTRGASECAGFLITVASSTAFARAFSRAERTRARGVFSAPKNSCQGVV
jgi:hypothetical protein